VWPQYETQEETFGPWGAIEAFVEVKEKGLTGFVGVTGHHDSLITRRCLERFDFDRVLIPVNPAEPAHKSYLTEIIPAAKKKGMGVVGMKVYLRGFADRPPWFETMEPTPVPAADSRSRQCEGCVFRCGGRMALGRQDTRGNCGLADIARGRRLMIRG
jgi:hypothetical protein